MIMDEIRLLKEKILRLETELAEKEKIISELSKKIVFLENNNEVPKVTFKDKLNLK